jgi:hypothetical protein
MSERELDPGMRADDPTDEELEAEDRARSKVTVGELAVTAQAERARTRAAPPQLDIRPMFPEREDAHGRKRS